MIGHITTEKIWSQHTVAAAVERGNIHSDKGSTKTTAKREKEETVKFFNGTCKLEKKRILCCPAVGVEEYDSKYSSQALIVLRSCTLTLLRVRVWSVRGRDRAN
ncbi:unnamed protein product [Brugia pahangi]|uniref:Uncharacterized protein n=1 Tax=Brugia pahangi TaxID=6280 RepID=A0A0N4SZM6_BRUPA|nr:unnamed protein product [Brugia pahangi]